MNVNLLDYQENALEILLYTKNTRLQGESTLQEVMQWPMEKKLEELAYMRDTIKSSWEFASYIFEIKNVTRAFTHQLVRTRTASYAQESFRSGDASAHGWLTPEFEDEVVVKDFNDSILKSFETYNLLVELGMPRQDARGVIPTNVLTNIIMKVDLRSLHQMAEVRLCTRTQGEYQDVFREMRQRVIEVHPWAEDFIQVYCVNHGTCCFPRYEKCPIKKYVVDEGILSQQKQYIKMAWETQRHEAVVESKNGRSM